MVDAGVSQPIVDRWLGHTPDPTEMANIYDTLEDRDSQEKVLPVAFNDTADSILQTMAITRSECCGVTAG